MTRLWRWAQVLVVLAGTVLIASQVAFGWVLFFSTDQAAGFQLIALGALIGYASPPLAVGLLLGTIALHRTPAVRSRRNVLLIASGAAVFVVALWSLSLVGLI